MKHLIFAICLVFSNMNLSSDLFAYTQTESIAEIDSLPFQSIDDVINFETLQILQEDSDNPATLSDKYLSRAESYLLSGNNELAFIDFKTATNLLMTVIMILENHFTFAPYLDLLSFMVTMTCSMNSILPLLL